ncbi:MAG TPA: hypothetical protein ENJ83_05395 [Rhodospirillales bacterium]|nr:hypothetical protein [Rhodospirillales bacterium]
MEQQIVYVPGPPHPDLFGGETPIMVPSIEPAPREWDVEVLEVRRVLVEDAADEHEATDRALTALPPSLTAWEVVEVQEGPPWSVEVHRVRRIVVTARDIAEAFDLGELRVAAEPGVLGAVSVSAAPACQLDEL